MTTSLSLVKRTSERSPRPKNSPLESMSDSWVDLDHPHALESSSFWVQIEKYKKVIRRCVAGVGLKKDQIDDVAQEVYCDLLQRTKKSQSDSPDQIADFRKFLAAMARYKAIKYRRRLNRQPGRSVGGELNHILLQEIAYSDSSSGPGSTVLYRLDRAVKIAERDLNERTWKAFHQTCIVGRPAKDVAHEMGLTVNAVYIARSRALRRIKEEFKSINHSQRSEHGGAEKGNPTQ